ncbi:MAG: ABC transporter permease [Anaerolineae bacterium]|nr:ABC transporter permease [Anaerolineae bacterium]
MKLRFILSLILFALIVLMPHFAPFDPMSTDIDNQMLPPNNVYLFGTDFLGRDVLSRFLHGGQRTLMIAVGATLLAAVPGTISGILTGRAGYLANFISIPINAVLAFPNLLLALVVLTVLGKGDWTLVFAVGIAQIAPYTKVIQAATLELQSAEYVEASRSIGASSMWIALNHILPNIQPTILTYTGITFSYCLLNGAALSFLGLGGGTGIPDWGVMLSEGRMVFRGAPWVAFPPGLAITIIVWIVNRLAVYQPQL